MNTEQLKPNQQQIDGIAEMLRPPCCHVTGMHDPRHYCEGKYVCESQKAKAYDRFRAALGLDEVAPGDCVVEEGCFWCSKEEAA